MRTNLKYLKKNNKFLLKQANGQKYDIDFIRKQKEDLEYANQQLKRELQSLVNKEHDIL